MLDKNTERLLQRMDRMGFAGAGEALREIKRLREDELAQAKAEIERLRGLLREAEKMWPNPGLSTESASWYRRVHEALGE